MSGDLVADRVMVRSFRDRWTAPTARWGVHRMGQRVIPFQKLAEAKRWVAENYGPVTWERSEYPNGRETGVEWKPSSRGGPS